MKQIGLGTEQKQQTDRTCPKKKKTKKNQRTWTENSKMDKTEQN